MLADRQRRAIAIAVLTTLLVATAAVWILVALRGPATSPAAPAGSPPAPPALSGPVFREAGFAGEITVGVAVAGHQLQVVLEGPSGAGIEWSANLTPAGHQAAAPVTFVGCGDGCGTAAISVSVGVSTLSVKASAPGWLGGTYTSSITWPPPPLVPALLTKVIGVMRVTPRLTLRQVTSTGPYRAQPVEAQISGLSFFGLQLFLIHAVDVRALPDGKGLSLYVPSYPLWVTMWLDGQDRITRESVLSNSDEVDSTFTYPSS